MTVTHEKLAIAIEQLNKRVGEIDERLNKGPSILAKIDALRIETMDALAHMEARQAEDRGELKTLLEAEFRRQGREGVWSAIVRSPAVGWLAAIGTAIAAFIAGTGGKAP